MENQMMKKNVGSLKMNLQLFAANNADQAALDSVGGVDQVPDGPPQPTIPNPLLTVQSDNQAVAEGEEGNHAQQQIEELDFGGRRIPVLDPALKELHGDWTELNRSYQQLNQRLLELEQQNQQYQQFMQLYQQQFAGQQQQSVQPQETPEERQRRNEELMQRFYEDPSGVLEELVEQRVNQIVQNQVLPQIEPIQRERQMQQQLQETAAKYPDFQNYAAQMQQVFAQHPHLAELPNAFETAYFIAKGMAANPVNPDDLLNDPQFQEKILSNEQIRNKIISDHIDQVKQKQTVPQPMGTQAGGQQAALPEEMPKTLQEGSRAFMKYLGINK